MASFFTRSSSASSSSGDAANRLVSSRCPECGAPVDFRRVPRNQTQVKCAYCGTLMGIPGRAEAALRPPTPTTITVTSDGSLVKGGWGCGAVGWTILIVILVAGVWAYNSLTIASRVVSEVITNDSSNDLPGFKPLTLPSIPQPFVAPPRLVTAPLLLGGNESAPTQIIVTAYQEDNSLLLGFDPVKRAETWRATLLSDKYYDMGMSADAARVYVADGATLMALDRERGKTLWQISLANNLQTGCAESAPCLQVVGDQVVTLARDGTMQGFAGSSGAPLWSRRFNAQPRQFLVHNDQVIVVDNDDGNRAVVYVINGVNGDEIYQLVPSCVYPNIEMRPHSSDQYRLTPDGAALVIVSSGSYACAWRYSLLDGTLTWNYIQPDTNGSLPFTWSMSSLTLADPVIYFTKDDNDRIQIYALDSQIQGSTPQPLYGIEDYALTILYPLGDLLLVSAQPDFARDEVELWAIERDTGERRWQRKLETTHSFDEWVTRPTNQGIFLSVCFWNVDECRFEVLDITTGTSKGQVREATHGSYSGAAWLGNEGFLTVDGKILAINLTTAQVEYTWP